MIALDDRDLAILKAVSQNGRITKLALAEQVGLSPTPCWNRLKRLENANVIESYSAQLNLSKITPHVTVFVAAELTDHTAVSFRKFEEAIKSIDDVVACWALGGGFDYLLQFITRDIDAYQRRIDVMLDARIGLARYFTYIVTKPIKGADMPPLAALLGAKV
jgi:Lrp/AsnC family transcriptional regulator of ectoine degradation